MPVNPTLSKLANGETFSFTLENGKTIVNAIIDLVDTSNNNQNNLLDISNKLTAEISNARSSEDLLDRECSRLNHLDLQ